MVLFLIGLGLGNIKDITVKGIFSGYACAANCKHKGLITKSSGWNIHSDIFDKLLIITLITFGPSSRMPSECTVLLVLFYMIEENFIAENFIEENFIALSIHLELRTQKLRDKTIGFWSISSC